MAISTKEISKRLRQKAIESSKPFINQCVEEGMDRNMIVQAVKTQVQSKINKYYAKHRQPQTIGSTVKQIADYLEGKFTKSADSKAEIIFYDILEANKIKFQFQYLIGPITVDYFVGEDLVVELDGPMHDRNKDDLRDDYLAKKGYRVLRIPIWVLANDPDAVINEIKAIAK